MTAFAAYRRFGSTALKYATGVTVTHVAAGTPNVAAIYLYPTGYDEAGGGGAKTLTLPSGARAYNYTWYVPGNLQSYQANGNPGEVWHVRALPGSGDFDGSSSARGVWLPLTSTRVFSITNNAPESVVTNFFQLQFSTDGGVTVNNADNSVSPYGGNYNVTLVADTRTTPPDGGGGGGDDGSVAVLSYLPGTPKFAGEMKPGDPLILLGDDMESTKTGPVLSNRISLQRLVRMTTESGITLTCSDNTPMTLRDGSSCNSTDILGKDVPVMDERGFRWEEVMRLDSAGMGEVTTIYCLDQCYAAGDHPGRYIFTHNAIIVKP